MIFVLQLSIIIQVSNSVYQINKGINRSIEFRGLKAQYIWYLGGGIVLLLFLFAILYICGVNLFVCLAAVAILGCVLFTNVYKLSRTYGENGLMKKIACKRVPKVIKNYSHNLVRKNLMHD